MEKIIECAFCDAKALLTSEEVPFIYKKKRIVFDQLFYKCAGCKEEFTFGGIDDINVNRIKEKYQSGTKLPDNITKSSNNIPKKADIVTPIPEDSTLTTDPKNPKLHETKEDSNQNKAYIVLSDEERGKGYVRPVRRSYLHVGAPPLEGRDKVEPFSEEDILENNVKYAEKKYIGLLPVYDKEGKRLGAKYVTEEDFKGKPACNTTTTMAQILAETYARDPKFYGSTFCSSCNNHFPVKEFVWTENVSERVGS